ncbi:hypothetical protein APHAL10511_004107 [Amanita phalloides]|nr:hypothetical protein APHAL10511_004107 [Amanita phalloides]
MDIWSSQLQCSFLVVTAHWISRDETTQCLEYTSSLITFHNLQGSHLGERIARTILPLLDHIGVTHNAGHWTMDNAKNNDTFIANLGNLLNQREIVYDASQHCIMSQKGSDNSSNITVDELDDLGATILVAEHMEDDSDSNESEEALGDVIEGPRDELRQTYEQALCHKPLDLVQRTIHVIRSSSQHWEFLKQVISDGNKSRRFKDANGKTMKVPLLQPLLDIKTHWDSTYLMIV